MSKLAPQACTVVYIDDSQDDHYLLQYSVAATGVSLQLRPFFLPEPALAYLRRDPPYDDGKEFPFPDFVLCDYDLNSTHAPAVIAAIRQMSACASLKVFVFSGSDDGTSVASSYMAGADGYICKPVLPDRRDAIVRALYRCATLKPPCFKGLTDLPEYQRQPGADFSGSETSGDQPRGTPRGGA